MKKYKVLIVEDDEITSLYLSMSLQKHNYTVVAMCDNILQAKQKLKSHHPDIVLVDISLEKKNDGIELAKYINKYHKLPFIYLTSHGDNEMIESAKSTGAYGYIIKPFEPNSLHATLQMALFKFEQEITQNSEISTNTEKKSIIYFDAYSFDMHFHQLFYKNESIKLTKKENEFLYLLLSHIGRNISFEQAISYIWHDEKTSANSIRTLVWRLRQKLPTSVIQSASGIGYYIQKD